MDKTNLDEKLEVCINAIQMGADIDSCLELFPQDAPALRPLLHAADMAASLQPPPYSADAFHRSRTQLLGEANRIRRQKTAEILGWRIPRLALATLTVLLILVFGTGGLILTSAQSLPGDQIYPLKLAVENLRLQLLPEASAGEGVRDIYYQRRAIEIQHLLDLGRVENISLVGEVQEISDQFWIVEDILVRVDQATELVGEIELGTVVKVNGLTSQDGWVSASEIHLVTREIVGKLAQIDEQTAIVGGETILIDSNTERDPRLKTGDQVIALIEVLEDGRNYTRAIIRMP
jgi:hypothetical protein